MPPLNNILYDAIKNIQINLKYAINKKYVGISDLIYIKIYLKKEKLLIILKLNMKIMRLGNYKQKDYSENSYIF